MAIKFLNSIETSVGSIGVKSSEAALSPLLDLHNTNGGAGATIRFTDQAVPTQFGFLTYLHVDGSSQGGGNAFVFTGQPDTVLQVGDANVSGRVVVKSHASVAEVDYGFYDDLNTGMVRTSADNVSLVAGGVAGVGVGTTAVSLKYAGSTKLQTTSGGIGVTGDINTSGNANINGGNITINGSYPRFNMYSNDAGEDDWSIINNNGIFGIYNNTATAYALSISETVNTVIINSGNIQLNGTGRITGVDTVSAGTDAANKAYVDNAVSPPTAPAASTTVTTAVVGETIEVTFNESATSDIDYYQVWSADPSGNFGIIAQIAPGDFASTMTVVDTSFNVSGTISYRVYAVKLGIYSTAATSTQVFLASALSVTAMTVVNLNTAYYVQYEKPSSRFINNIEIYMDSQATQAALNRSNASIVYSGQNASYMRNVGASNNFHQFWVEVTTT